MQALLPAHSPHLLRDVHMPADDPPRLHVTDVFLPPGVGQPLLHAVEHLQRRIGAIAFVQALLPAHSPHLALDVHLPVVGPSPLHVTDVSLPPVVCHERRQLIDVPQLRNASAAARMHHKCVLLRCGG